MNESLSILSRYGWDRVGALSDKRVLFRHAGTGEENTIAPGEIPYWAAQFVSPTPPRADDDWYATTMAGSAYLWHVRSKSGRIERGVTHTQRGDLLIFQGDVIQRRKAAERAAAVLNARDRARTGQPVQLEMVLS